MAFDKKGWGNVVSVMGNARGVAGGRTVAHSYATPDNLATLLTANYFLEMQSVLKVGDVILVVAGVGTAPDFLFVQVDTSTTTALTVSRKNDVVIGDQPAIADLTENAGAIGGVNDGNLPDLSAPTAALNAEAIRELAARVNALQTMMRTAGLLTP